MCISKLEMLFLRKGTKKVRTYFLLTLLTATLPFAIISCAPKEVKREESIKVPPVRQNKPNLSVLQKPVLAVNTKTLAEKSEKRKYTLVFRDAPLREVLMTLARDKGINVIFDETVESTKPVSLDIKGVTFHQALKIICQSYGLSYLLDGNVLWIYKNRIVTRIFKIRSVNVKRDVELSSSIESGGTSGSQGGSSSGSTGGLYVSCKTSSTFDVWNDVGCNICAMLGLSCSQEGSTQAAATRICSGNGKFVAINRTTGHMIVGATYGEIKKVKEYMEAATSSLSKQAILDVKLIEITLNRGSEMGVDWSKIFHSHKYAFTFSQSSTAGGTLMPIPGFSTFSLTPRPSVKNPLSILINALSKFGKVHLISSPRIAVLNNQAAVIKIGEDMKFVTDVSSTTTVTSGGTVTGCDVDTETYFVGVSLTVTPYVDEKGDVTIYLHPSVTELKEVRLFQSECGNVPLEEPVFDVRELDTMVKVRDGDTIVIGGLIKNYSKEESYRTPGLSSIPILGSMFKREEKTIEKKELVILITPKVIYGTSRPVSKTTIPIGQADILER